MTALPVPKTKSGFFRCIAMADLFVRDPALMRHCIPHSQS